MSGDYKTILEQLPAEIAQEPTMPVATYLAEAGALDAHLREHGEAAKALLAVGLDRGLIAELPERCTRLRDAQSNVAVLNESAKPAEQAKLEEEGYSIREDLLAGGRYVFRKDTAKLAVVSRITDGDSLAELPQDLNDAAELAEQERPRFLAIGIDEVKIGRARELAGILGTRPAPKLQSDKLAHAIELRNRAFGHLMEAVEEIRAAGQYVYRKDKSMVSHFRSRYAILRGRRARKNAAAKKAETPNVTEE